VLSTPPATSVHTWVVSRPWPKEKRLAMMRSKEPEVGTALSSRVRAASRPKSTSAANGVTSPVSSARDCASSRHQLASAAAPAAESAIV
jgi:hypothetical protein